VAARIFCDGRFNSIITNRLLKTRDSVGTTKFSTRLCQISKASHRLGFFDANHGILTLQLTPVRTGGALFLGDMNDPFGALQGKKLRKLRIAQDRIAREFENLLLVEPTGANGLRRSGHLAGEHRAGACGFFVPGPQPVAGGKAGVRAA
jgi:hypothetical protein